MRRRGRALVLGSLLAAAVGWVPIAGRLYLDRPPLAHTGGFGEPSCHQCHFDGALDDGAGTLRLQGLPERFEPGRSYRISVALARPGLGAAGFQMAARYAGGAAKGEQAGAFRVLDARAALDRDSARSLEYLHHTRAGTSPTGRDSATWTVEWTAPRAAAPVVFHVAGNAANGDESQFGDFIYLHSDTLRASD